MMYCLIYVRRFALLLCLAALCLCTQGDQVRASAPVGMSFATAMPQTVLWAWEEPEDLRATHAESIGIAYLAETLLLDKAQAGSPGAPALAIRSRHQPLAVAPGAAVMAVVRVEPQPDFRDSTELRHQTARALAEVARRPSLRALQVDFDATRSQRLFYVAVLRELRPQMPAGMPLSITALLSWCAADPSNDDWMAALPIDEAVPMFFRLGGSARPGADKSGFPLREPLCRGSVGISTDESWPSVGPHQRVYLFAPRPWTPVQLVAVEAVIHGQRAAALEPDKNSLRTGNDTGLHARGRVYEEDGR